MPHASLNHGVGLAEPVRLVLLPPDVGPLDDDEDEGAHPEQHAYPSPCQGRLNQSILQDGLIPSIISEQVLLVPIAIVVVEGLDVVVMKLLVVVGVSEDGPAGHPHSVQVLAEGVPHLARVAPELVVIMKPNVKDLNSK